MNTNRDIEAEAYEAWEEHSVTEVFESSHWYEVAKNEWIEDYIAEHNDDNMPDSKAHIFVKVLLGLE